MLIVSIAGFFGLAALSSSPTAPAAPVLAPVAAPAASWLAPQGKTQQRMANLNVLIGQRMIDDNAWDPNENQFTVGMEFDTYRRDEWVGLDAGFHYGDDDSGGGLGQTTEMFLGARKTFDIGATGLHPYVAVGATYLWATNGVASGNTILAEQDSSIGAYARGGIYMTFANVVNLGVDVRGVFGTSIDALGADSADYFQVAGFVGWSM